MIFSKTILLISAAAYLSFGLWAMIDPGGLMAYVSIGMLNGNSFAETTTMYGGVDTALGAFFLFTALNLRYTQLGILFGCFNYTGLTFGRALGIVLYSPPSMMLFVGLLVLEAVFCALFWWAWWQLKRSEES